MSPEEIQVVSTEVRKVRELTNTLHVHAHDGYSVNIRGDVPTDGYMVGGEVDSLVLTEDDLFPMRDTDTWLVKHLDLLDNPVYFAGVWTDADTGKVYVDISRKVDDLYTALAIAESRGELAIWDVVNGKEIRTELEPATA
jgi:hypothetical protein